QITAQRGSGPVSRSMVSSSAAVSNPLPPGQRATPPERHDYGTPPPAATLRTGSQVSRRDPRGCRAGTMDEPWARAGTGGRMDQIECMRAFVEAVRANGFAAAARILDVPRSKVSKQVKALEDMLGVQLLMRTTRTLHLTEAGASYYEDAQEVLAALDEADERARGATGLRGTIRCNVPVSF